MGEGNKIPGQCWGRRLVGALLVLGAVNAWSAVDQVSPAGFVITWQRAVEATPAHLFESIGPVQQWWNPAHTWSGDAGNLSLAPTIGGCFCERWPDGGAEHGRVIFVSKNKLIRLRADLGPLQRLAVNAILDFAVETVDNKTQLTVRYRVSGNPDAGLDKLASPVDQVLGEQFNRLVKFAETGSAQ